MSEFEVLAAPPIAPPVEPALSPLNRDEPLRRDEPIRAKVVADDIACDGCGYNLRSLQLSAACPECGRAVADSLMHLGSNGIVSRVDRRWTIMVFVGLAALLLLYPSLLWVDLNMSFPDVAFGTGPKLNVPGPKIWAVPLVQRSIGGHPEWLGAQGTWLPLMSLLAVGLITTPRRAIEAADVKLYFFRLATRWAPAILLGGFFGFLLNAEDTYSSDVAVGKYSMFGVVGVELPCTALLFAYLAHVSGALGERSLRTRFHIAIIGTVIAQCAGIAMAMVAGQFAPQRKDLLVQVWSACYEAFCCIVALLIVSAMMSLMWTLASRLVAKRWRSWFA